MIINRNEKKLKLVELWIGIGWTVVKSIVRVLSANDKVGIIGVSNKLLLFDNEDDATCLSNTNYCGNSSVNGTNGSGGPSNRTDDHRSTTSTSSARAAPAAPPAGRNRTLRAYPVSTSTKKRIIDFIDKLNSTQEATNHSLGFKFAFALLKRIYQDRYTAKVAAANEPLPVTFVYVTRGLFFPLAEAKTVMDTICRGQSELPFPVQINVVAQIIDEKRVMYEKQFLADIVQQNYSKYGVDALTCGRPTSPNKSPLPTSSSSSPLPSQKPNQQQPQNEPGTIYFLKSASDIQAVAMSIFTKYYEANHSLDRGLIIHSPVIDVYSKGKLGWLPVAT